MLASRMDYLTAGAHIGMKTYTKKMKRFIYEIRSDGLAVFNIQKIDERISLASNLLYKFEKIMVVSRKANGKKPIKKFSEIVGGRAVPGRFPPGMLTNPSFKEFYEPDIVLVVDPLIDKQAVEEAKKRRLPIVALCDTFNEPVDVDLIIPANNNGRKSIALIFMLLAREILRKRKKIKDNKDFKYTLKDFGGE